MKIYEKFKSLVMQCPAAANFGVVVGMLLAIMLAEFGILYLTGANRTFWNPYLQALPMFLALSTPALWLGKNGSRIYLQIVLPLLIISTVCSILVTWRYKIPIDGDIIPVVLASSVEETHEFINSIFGFFPVMVILIALAGIIAACRWVWRHPIPTSRCSVLIGLLVLLPWGVSSIRYLVIGKAERIINRTTYGRLVQGYFAFKGEFDNLEKIAAVPELPGVIEKIRPDVRNMVGVIVVGESANRNHMGIYGYSRATDPEVRRMEPPVMAFDNVISAYASTSWALRYLLTMSEIGRKHNNSRCTFTDMLKAGGYRVEYYSNQYRWGEHDGPVNLLFAHADRVLYIQEIHRDSRDDALLPYLRRSLAANQGPLVVFLHLIGSHTQAKMRYPESWGPFNHLNDEANKRLEPEYAERLNEYDNSIAFTDKLLGEVVQELKKLDRPTFMLYVSDHGEVVDDGQRPLRSGKSREPDAYEVPFILWLSEPYRKLFPKFAAEAAGNVHVPLQTDRAIFGMLALAQLTYAGFPQQDNVFSRNFQAKPRTLDSGSVPYNKEKP